MSSSKALLESVVSSATVFCHSCYFCLSDRISDKEYPHLNVLHHLAIGQLLISRTYWKGHNCFGRLTKTKFPFLSPQNNCEAPKILQVVSSVCCPSEPHVCIRSFVFNAVNLFCYIFCEAHIVFVLGSRVNDEACWDWETTRSPVRANRDGCSGSSGPLCTPYGSTPNPAEWTQSYFRCQFWFSQ